MTENKLKPFNEIWSDLPPIKIYKELEDAINWVKNLIEEVNSRSQ